MDHEAFCVSHVGKVREEFQIIYKFTSGLKAALDSEHYHAAEAVPKIFSGNRERGIILQSRISYPVNL